MSVPSSEPLEYPIAPVPTPVRPPRTARRRLGFWQLYFLGLVYVIFAVLCFETLLGDTFVIRTSSMEPTIIGRPDGGDRVVLSRVHTAFRGSRRFDILLFRYPNNLSVSYMKRLVGLPQEQLMIHGGDLFLADVRFAGTINEGLLTGRVAIVKKPEWLTNHFFDAFPVLFASELPTLSMAGLKKHFLTSKEQDRCFTETADGGHVRVTAEQGPSVARSRREPRDILYDATTEATDRPPAETGLGGNFPVGDLSLRIAVTLDAASIATLQIHDPAHAADLEARISPKEVVLLLGDQVLGSADVALRDGERRVRFDNVDDRVSVRIDDELVIARDYTHPVPEVDAQFVFRRGGFSFGTYKGSVVFGPPRIHRDIYYLQEGQSRFLIPEDHFVLLGDNTASSSDSRIWQRAAVSVRATGEVLLGDEQAVTLEGRTIIGKNPWTTADGRTAFVDLTGTTHLFEDRDEIVEFPSWPTPFVHRRHVLGQGVLTIAPFHRVGRLR